ncbi:MAG: nucleotidyltransferase family protein [Thiogranum sp.]|nr:nucleotidyltransferase family protein [Thiogranum sp.]
MKYLPEVELLLLCARPRTDESVAHRIAELLQQKPDWESLFRLADYYRTIPKLAMHLHHQPADLLPGAIQSALQARHRDTTRHNLVLSLEILRLVDLLATEGIAVVPFKGPVSAMVVYGDMAMRACGDIDLLVKRDDHRRAERILETDGYAVEQRYEEAMQSTLWRESSGISIDLHWGIPPARLRLDAERFRDDLRPVNVLGRPVLTFSPRDTLLVTAVNAVKEFWKPSLHHLSDIASLTADYTDDDWAAAFDRAGETGCRRMLATAVLFAHRMLDITLPSAGPGRLFVNPGINRAVDELQAHLFPQEPDATDGSVMRTFHLRDAQRYYLILTDSWWRRTRDWLGWVVKPNAADQAFVALPGKLSFLYFFIRPIRLLIKRL